MSYSATYSLSTPRACCCQPEIQEVGHLHTTTGPSNVQHPICLQTTQPSRRQAWLMWGEGFWGPEREPQLPLPPHLPLLLTRSSCRGMPARSATSVLAVSNTSPEMVSKRKSPHELLRRWGWSRAWSGQPLGRVRLLDGPSVKAQVCRLQPELLSSPSALYSRARGGHRELVQGPCFFPSSRG